MYKTMLTKFVPFAILTSNNTIIFMIVVLQAYENNEDRRRAQGETSEENKYVDMVRFSSCSGRVVNWCTIYTSR